MLMASFTISATELKTEDNHGKEYEDIILVKENQEGYFFYLHCRIVQGSTGEYYYEFCYEVNSTTGKRTHVGVLPPLPTKYQRLNENGNGGI